MKCGYHLRLKTHLATAVERESRRAIDPNPYAPSASVDAPSKFPQAREPHVADLTDAGARKAKAIVADANSVYWAILLAWCCCQPAWLLMLPWYGWRLWSWYQLNAQFNELRHPYGFSPHGELAASFQDSRLKLWIGVVAGSIFWGLIIVFTAVDALRILDGD